MPKILTKEELRKRCYEVWPDEVWEEGYHGEGVTNVERTEDGNALITWEYVDDGPQYRWHTTHFKKGMKRRPQALAYVCGERDDFNDNTCKEDPTPVKIKKPTSWIKFNRESFATDEDWETVCEEVGADPLETETVKIYIDSAEITKVTEVK